MIPLEAAAAFVRLHRGKDVVIKVGGACLEREGLRRALARQIAVVEACGARPVIVHGGGPQTDRLQRALGEEPRKVLGRRVTSALALRALTMATRGELNAEVCAALAAEGAKAVGLAASDFVRASRRPPVSTPEGPVDFGEVGDIVRVDPEPLRALQHAGFIPVICPPAGGPEGAALNVNADLLAAHVAIALGAAKLVLCTDAPGVLLDPSDSASVASTLSLAQLDELEQADALRGGMAVKAAAIRLALERGVSRVHVVSGLEAGALLGELYTTQGAGTLLTKEPQTAPVETALGAFV